MQGFKRMLGLSLFWASWLIWGLVLLVPFVFEADAETVAMLVAAMLASAEVCFVVSLFLLGKPFYLAFKARLRPYWNKVSGRSPTESS